MDTKCSLGWCAENTTQILTILVAKVVKRHTKVCWSRMGNVLRPPVLTWVEKKRVESLCLRSIPYGRGGTECGGNKENKLSLFTLTLCPRRERYTLAPMMEHLDPQRPFKLRECCRRSTTGCIGVGELIRKKSI